MPGCPRVAHEYPAETTPAILNGMSYDRRQNRSNTHRSNTIGHFSRALMGHRCHLDTNPFRRPGSQRTTFRDKWRRWCHSNDATSRIFCKIENHKHPSGVLFTPNVLIFNDGHVYCLQCLRSQSWAGIQRSPTSRPAEFAQEIFVFLWQTYGRCEIAMCEWWCITS